MIGKNNHYLKNTKEGTKVESYSIKKFKVGTASVVIGASIFFGAGAVAHASEDVSNNTTSDNTTNSNISEGVVGAPVATEQPVAKDTTKKDVASAVASKLNATEKETLDKTSLTKLIEEIDGKFSNGKYDSKTEESVNRLKAVLEEAKTVLNNANTQAELTKAQARLATATTQLKTKPTEKKVAPEVDTTNGKPTVGKKAENTEKATDSNSISNSGTRDERNGKALNKENAFRTDGATTDNDPSANQTYTAPSADASLGTLVNALKNLPDVIENNAKVKDMNTLGDEKNVDPGTVKEITEFGGWKAVGENGKFAIAKATDKGVFPLETINIPSTNQAWIEEQSFDRNSKYMLFLSKVRSKANQNEEAFDGKPYLSSGEGGPNGAVVARGTKWFDGIEKTFKSYTPDTGSKVKIKFKTGYTGIVEAGPRKTRANYKVTVFNTTDGKNEQIYSAEFDPGVSKLNSEMTVVAAQNGSGGAVRVGGTTETAKNAALETLSQSRYKPGSGGTFESKDIILAPGVKTYKVVIRAADDELLGMSYQSNFLQYALPITGLDYTINQETNEVAKSLLQRVYNKLKETEAADTKGKTETTINAYKAQLENVKNLLAGDLKATQDYKNLVTAVLTDQEALRTDKSKLNTSNTNLLDLINENPDPRIGKTPNSKVPYETAKQAAEEAQREAQGILSKENPNPDVVAAAVSKLNEKLAELKAAKAELVVAASDTQKTKLAADKAKLVEASKEGKTQDSINAYEARYNALKPELDTAVAAANDVANAQENASKVSALEAQEKVTEVLAKLEEAKALLKEKATDAQIAELKKAETALTPISDDKLGNKKPTSVQKYKDAVDAIQQELTETKTKVAELLEKAKTDNAAKEEAAQLISKVDALKSKLTDAAILLEDKANTGGLETAKDELKAEAAEQVTDGKTPETVTPYNEAVKAAEAAVKAAEDVIKNPNATQEAVNTALQEVTDKKAALAEAKKALVEAATEAQKTTLATDASALVPASKEGKTPESVKAYEDKLKELNTELEAAKAAAQAIADKGENAGKDAAIAAQAKVSAIKAKLADAAGLLKDKANTSALETAKDELKAEAAEQVTDGKTPETVTPYNEAVKAAEAAVKAAEDVIKNPNATQEAVNTALQEVTDKKAALAEAKKALVEAATQDQKDELANADEDLKLADTAGKTNDSIKVYNEEVGKLSAELEATKQAAKDLLAKGDNAGELEAYRLQAKISKLKSKLLEASKLLKDIDKSAVKKEVEEVAKNVTDAIVANNDLTPEQKEVAKAKVAEEANKAIATIDKATTEDDVTTAKNSAKLAIAKELAKAELEAAKAIKEKVIAGNDKLSDDEKQAVKEQIKNIVDEAKKAIDTATEQSTVDTAKTTAKEGIDALNPVGKDKAKEAIDSALSAKETAIDSNDKLSDVEKSAAKEAAKKAAEDAKKAINEATTQAEVDDKVTEGTKAISSVTAVGKDKAKGTIDSALSAKEAAIDSNDKLSDVEKSEAKEAVKKAAEDAKKAIDKATTQAEVEEKLSAGLKAISDVTPIAKAKAIEEIEKAKKAKEEAIDANSQLLDEEKDELKEKIAEEAKKAIEKITAATTESHVTLETNSGKEEISKVKNEDNYKEKAKKDVQEKLEEKLAEIEAMPALTKEQKEKEKSKVETEAKKALAAIDDSKTTTKEEVDKEVRNFIYRILGAILDIEDYDLSKLLVKGTVEIEQGKEISDSDILSKIDLPSDVKVKNIEKPSTEQLGKVLSRVTLILVDNSTLTIDVPVEVVQAHTTPDEKPSTELTKFKELAKQDVKEKLAGKLSELEQATNLTESQKQAMVNKLKESAEKAISDIEKASSKEAVEQVLRKFILAVKPEVLEKEEYDLSKVLVNGRLVVKRGEKLSDEDILAKINLPKGAEVINIEKPTTLALGKTQARVEFKLSDGTIITIEVPIEVIKGESASSEMKRSPEQTSANEQVSTNITSKKLPNTGATETNTGLAGLGLGIFGGLLAAAKRRRERKED